MQRKVVRLLATLGLGAAVFVGSTAAAEAAVIITFDNRTSATGTVGYNGNLGSGALVGNDITFDIVTVENGVATELNCVGCLLDFTTGAATAEIGTGLVTFGGGGSFVVTGAITTLGGAPVASGVLLSGTFSGPVPANASLGIGGQIRIAGSGIDSKNADLLRFFGFSQDQFIFANTDISAVGCDADLSNGFGCDVVEADIVNTQIAAPEPATMGLFGLALFGLGGAIRRRFSA